MNFNLMHESGYLISLEHKVELDKLTIVHVRLEVRNFEFEFEINFFDQKRLILMTLYTMQICISRSNEFQSSNNSS